MNHTEQLTQDAYRWNIKNGRPLDKILDWVIENKEVLGGAFVAEMSKVILSEVISHKYSNEIVVDSIINGVNNAKQAIIEEIEGFINIEEKNIETFMKFIEAEILKKSINKEAESLKEQIEKGAEVFYEEAASIATDVEATGASMISKGLEFLGEGEQWLDGIGKDFGNMFGFGGGYSGNSGTYIKVDTNKLRDYATEMEMLRRQASDIESRINNLYFKAGIKNIGHLIKSSYMEINNYKIKAIIDYLNYTADTFDNAERKIADMANRL